MFIRIGCVGVGSAGAGAGAGVGRQSQIRIITIIIKINSIIRIFNRPSPGLTVYTDDVIVEAEYEVEDDEDDSKIIVRRRIIRLLGDFRCPHGVCG